MVSPLRVDVDLDHGGRWTGLRDDRREWLWHRPDPARDQVRPGDPFVDGGGIEECVPTVRGIPDHGAAWSRPWHRADGADCVRCADFELRRRISATGNRVLASYTLHAAPGFRFVWAAHALLNLSADAELLAPAGTRTWVDPGVIGPWPAPNGVRLDRLGPDDGTAVGAILTDCPSVTVVDGTDRLRVRLSADPGVPVSVALWRNLGGFPADDPYRSIGVEPMLGTVFDLADAGPGGSAIVPDGGMLGWRLEWESDAAD